MSQHVEHVSRDCEQEQNIQIARLVTESLQESLRAHEESSTNRIADAVRAEIDKQLEARVTKRKSLEFRNEGNKRRYNANEEILESMDKALREINKNDTDAARKAVTEGKNLLLKQQKLIRLADREELGWEVAKHYMSDELASDSEDEKAMKKARKEAILSINKKREKKRRDFRNSRARKNFEPRKNFENRERKQDFCYKCGRRGHWQKDCYSNSRR